MKVAPDLLYSTHHLWIRKLSENEYETGITDYAQDLLGDIVFVEFPKVGDVTEAGLACGLVESVKTGSDLHAPISGKVIALNAELESHPEQINDSPYKAWIFKFESTALDELKGLLSSSEYKALIE